MGRLEMDAFMRVSLPVKDKRLPFQFANFFSIHFIIGSQEDNLATLAPIGRPKYLIGNHPTLRKRIFAVERSHTSSIWMPWRELLWKFTFRPEASWKRMRVFFMLRRYSMLGGQKMIVSSAYCRWVNFVPPLEISTPSQSPRSSF